MADHIRHSYHGKFDSKHETIENESPHVMKYQVHLARYSDRKLKNTDPSGILETRDLDISQLLNH